LCASNSDIEAYLSGALPSSPYHWRGLDIRRLCEGLDANLDEAGLLAVIEAIKAANLGFDLRCSIQAVPGGARRQKSAAKVQRLGERLLAELREPENGWIEAIGAADCTGMAAFVGVENVMERGHIVIQLMEWLPGLCRSMRQKAPMCHNSAPVRQLAAQHCSTYDLQ
jgi:hypothetical protein